MDFSDLHNPYDFSNPVSNRELFIGRDNELEEIKYYLEQSRKAPRTINLALIGARASGKTSMLNMIDVEAQSIGFLTVRIDLDESDVENQLIFFYKLFDSLVTTSCQHGAFGGIASKTYDNFRNMVDAYEVPQDKTFCPFIFPIQYSRAMEKANYNAPISDSIFKQDLNLIFKEVNKPIAILFDECDVLTKSRIHLQKIRNIFMNVSGYMLIFAGTPNLFPVINDVFSPIIRQFKKISVGPFANEEDTEELIRSPLIKMGIDNPEVLFDFETYQDVKDIHNLSNGRPYEIQLICHFLFKRVQTGRAKKMELSLDVLDDVLRELQNTQDVSMRKVISHVKNFSNNLLTSLGIICTCNGHITFEQAFFLKEAFADDFKISRDELLKNLHHFEDLKIISIENDIINFSGDDFDKIYCKYLARKRGVFSYINDFPFELWMIALLSSQLQSTSNNAYTLPIMSLGSLPVIEVKEVVNSIQESNLTDPFEKYAEFAENIYWSILDSRHKEFFQIAQFTLSTPWETVIQWLNITSDDESQDGVQDLQEYAEDINSRVNLLGGLADIRVDVLANIDPDVLFRRLKISGNRRVRERVLASHIIRMREAYFVDNDVEEARLHAYASIQYSQEPKTINNYGYICLVENDLQTAKVMFENVLENTNESDELLFQRCLTLYNLAILEAKQNNFFNSLQLLQSSLDLVYQVDADKRATSCLLMPKVNTRDLDFPEAIDPDIEELIQYSMLEIKAFIETFSSESVIKNANSI